MDEELPPPPPLPRKSAQPRSAPVVAAAAQSAPTEKAEPKISAATLSELTGIPIPQLVKLAKQNYFPRASGDEYPLRKAIKGVCKWYSDQLEHALPAQYDTMAQCAARTPIPLSVLKDAKRAGCEAFKHSRVYFQPLLEWLFSDRNDEDPEEGKKVFDHYHGLREKLKHERESNQSLTKDDVTFVLNKGMALLFSLMDRRSNIELPPALKGLPETAIQKRLVDSDEALKNAVRGEFSKLIEIKETT